MSTPQTLKRINREISELEKELPDGILTAGPKTDANLFDWKGSIAGPAGSCYEGGVFQFSIVLPHDYPFRPPTVTFKTKIFHPNINAEVLLSISSLLTDPNPADPLVPDIATMYTHHRTQFEAKAREWVKRHALPPSRSKKITGTLSFSTNQSAAPKPRPKAKTSRDAASDIEIVDDPGPRTSDSRQIKSKKRAAAEIGSAGGSDQSATRTEPESSQRTKRPRNQVIEID